MPTIWPSEVVPLSIPLLVRLGETDPLMNVRRMSGPGYVYLLDGVPVVASGLGKVKAGHYVGWAVIRDEVRANKRLMVRITREIKRLLPAVCKALEVQSVIAETCADDKFCHWLEKLGFQQIPWTRYELKHD